LTYFDDNWDCDEEPWESIEDDVNYDPAEDDE
jgi:hypothetical protein